jgi:hypothetical protein
MLHSRFCTHTDESATHVRFGGMQPLTKPCRESNPVRARIGRVRSNLLDARLVQLLILASPRVVHLQAPARASRAHCGRAPQKWPCPLAILEFLLAAALLTAYQQQGDPEPFSQLTKSVVYFWPIFQVAIRPSTYPYGVSVILSVLITPGCLLRLRLAHTPSATPKVPT